MKYLLVLALVGCASSINLIGRTQSAGVQGTLKCHGKPASGVKVKLMESDNSFGLTVFDTDDNMAEGKTDSSGKYLLTGTNKEISGIEPYLAIYHNCDDSFKPGQRIVRINLPSSYVTVGSTPKKIYDAGQMELSGKFPGEKRSGLFG
ncbi:unnamed protein product [Auanema sp. JU1783]|nr:unnamed protein product [Auanema sp. JU1783]